MNKKYSAIYKGQPDTVPSEALRLPLRLYQARKSADKLAATFRTATLSKLDQARDALLAGQYQRAGQLLDQTQKARD